MGALILFLWLGPRPALAELAVEILIGLTLIGGGGGKRMRRTLQLFLGRMRWRPALGHRPARAIARG